MAQSNASARQLLRAAYLIILDRDLDTAKALILEAKAAQPIGSQADELLAKLYETQGRFEEARAAHFRVLAPPKGVQWSSGLDHARWMHYALLGRRLGAPEAEEAAAMAKIPGDTLWDKAVVAAVTAGEGGAYDWEIECWIEALRLRPDETTCVRKLAEAREAYRLWLPQARKEALKALETGPA